MQKLPAVVCRSWTFNSVYRTLCKSTVMRRKLSSKLRASLGFTILLRTNRKNVLVTHAGKLLRWVSITSRSLRVIGGCCSALASPSELQTKRIVWSTRNSLFDPVDSTGISLSFKVTVFQRHCLSKSLSFEVTVFQSHCSITQASLIKPINKLQLALRIFVWTQNHGSANPFQKLLLFLNWCVWGKAL